MSTFTKATFIEIATSIIFPPIITFCIACILLMLSVGWFLTGGKGPAIMIDMSLFFMSGTIISAFINLWLLAIRKCVWRKIFLFGFIAPLCIVLLLGLLIVFAVYSLRSGILP